VSSGLILKILPAVIWQAKALVYGWRRLDSASTRNIIFLPSTVIVEPQALVTKESKSFQNGQNIF
jgi:hypothetical protein